MESLGTSLPTAKQSASLFPSQTFLPLIVSTTSFQLPPSRETSGSAVETAASTISMGIFNKPYVPIKPPRDYAIVRQIHRNKYHTRNIVTQDRTLDMSGVPQLTGRPAETFEQEARYTRRRHMLSDPCRNHCNGVQMPPVHMEYEPWAYEDKWGVLTNLLYDEKRREAYYSYSRPTYSNRMKYPVPKIQRPQDLYTCCPLTRH